MYYAIILMELTILRNFYYRLNTSTIESYKTGDQINLIIKVRTSRHRESKTFNQNHTLNSI